MAQRRTAKKEAYFKLRLTTALFILKKQESFIKSKESKNSGLTIRKKMLAGTKKNSQERSLLQALANNYFIYFDETEEFYQKQGI